MPVALVLSCLAAAAFCSCTASMQTAKSYKLSDFYPLAKGSVWSYQITSFETDHFGVKAISAMRVTGEKNGEFFIEQGDKKFSYKLDASGLFKSKSGAYLLREPLAQGETWEVDLGSGLKGTARITEKPARVAVLDRTYENCVVIEETYKGVARLVSYYCPGTGLVKLEEYAYLDGRETLMSKVELLAYSPTPPDQE
jgi:hypothetical protein